MQSGNLNPERFTGCCRMQAPSPPGSSNVYTERNLKHESLLPESHQNPARTRSSGCFPFHWNRHACQLGLQTQMFSFDPQMEGRKKKANSDKGSELWTFTTSLGSLSSWCRRHSGEWQRWDPCHHGAQSLRGKMDGKIWNTRQRGKESS